VALFGGCHTAPTNEYREVVPDAAEQIRLKQESIEKQLADKDTEIKRLNELVTQQQATIAARDTEVGNLNADKKTLADWKDKVRGLNVVVRFGTFNVGRMLDGTEQDIGPDLTKFQGFDDDKGIPRTGKVEGAKLP
jgi:uncharacterized coiled-coil protein SlyX